MSLADEENLGTCHVSCTRELKGLSVRKRTGTRVYTRGRRSLACSKTVEHIAHTPSYYECEGRRFEYFDCANEREEVDSRTAIFHDFKPLEVCAMQACVLYGLAEYSGRLFQKQFYYALWRAAVPAVSPVRWPFSSWILISLRF